MHIIVEIINRVIKCIFTMWKHLGVELGSFWTLSFFSGCKRNPHSSQKILENAETDEEYNEYSHNYPVANL